MPLRRLQLDLAGKIPTVDLYASSTNRKCKRHRTLFRGPDLQHAVRGHPRDPVVYASPPLVETTQHLRDVQRQNSISKQFSILIVLGGTAMHESVRRQLEHDQGYRPGVRRMCKIPMSDMKLGPNSKGGLWGNDRFHAEAFLVGPGFVVLE